MQKMPTGNWIRNASLKPRYSRRKRGEKKRENEKRLEKASGSSAKNRERLNNFATYGTGEETWSTTETQLHPHSISKSDYYYNRNVFQFQYSTGSKSSLIHLSTGHSLSIQAGNAIRTSGSHDPKHRDHRRRASSICDSDTTQKFNLKINCTVTQHRICVIQRYITPHDMQGACFV